MRATCDAMCGPAGEAWWSGVRPSMASRRLVMREVPADHHQVLAEVPGELTEAAYRQARRGPLRPGGAGADREGMLAVIALREIRESIREAGLQPPQLPRELAWIDDPDS